MLDVCICILNNQLIIKSLHCTNQYIGYFNNSIFAVHLF